MGKVKLNPLLSSMSGELPPSQGKQCMRVRYGKQGLYHYEHKPETWSEAQLAVRQRIGVSQYLCKLIMSDEEKVAVLRQVFKEQKKYVRFDGYVRGLLIERLKADETLMAQGMTWLEEWKQVKMTLNEEAIKETMEEHRRAFLGDVKAGF